MNSAHVYELLGRFSKDLLETKTIISDFLTNFEYFLKSKVENTSHEFMKKDSFFLKSLSCLNIVSACPLVALSRK